MTYLAVSAIMRPWNSGTALISGRSIHHTGTGMPKLMAPKATPHLVEIERLRRAIPVSGYLALLHTAATTGALPILDLNGNPTGEFQKLDARDRLGIVTRLVDKAMPDRVEAPLLPEDTTTGRIVDVRNLSTEELESLANAPALKLTEFSETPGHGGGSGNGGNPGNEASGSVPGTATPEANPLHVSVHQRVPAGLGSPRSGGTPGSVHGSGGAEAEPEVNDLPAAADGQNPAGV